MTTAAASIYFLPPSFRASDADREVALRQLRGHWIAGRLDLEEYEQRCEQATGARYLAELLTATRELPAPAVAPAPAVFVAPRAPNYGEGAASLTLAVLGLVLLVISLGFMCFVSLPLSFAGWGVGRFGRGRVPRGAGSIGIAGEVVGIVGIVLGLLTLTLFM